MSNNQVMLYSVLTSNPVRIRPDGNADCDSDYKEPNGMYICYIDRYIDRGHFNPIYFWMKIILNISFMSSCHTPPFRL